MMWIAIKEDGMECDCWHIIKSLWEMRATFNRIRHQPYTINSLLIHLLAM